MMKLRYHSDSSTFYDKDGKLLSEPSQTLEELETMRREAITKYKSIGTIALPSANEYEGFDKELLRFNLANFIERLEWRIDLKLLHLEGWIVWFWFDLSYICCRYKR